MSKFKDMIKFQDICPQCGKANNTNIWSENIKAPNYDSEFYLCHYCGYFFRRHSNGDINVGITFDPRIIPLKAQLRAIRKRYEYYSGLTIEDCRKYKPPKYKKPKPDEQN